MQRQVERSIGDGLKGNGDWVFIRSGVRDGFEHGPSSLDQQTPYANILPPPLFLFFCVNSLVFTMYITYIS